MRPDDLTPSAKLRPQEQGASLRDRAIVASPSSPTVSPVPASIPSAQHTPGPWHLCQHLKSAADDAACSCGYRGVIFGPEHDVAMAICQPGHERPINIEEWGTEPCRYPRDVELANARLIAAAPELLEAVRSACDAIYEHAPGLEYLAESWEALIAKAQGTSAGTAETEGLRAKPAGPVA